MLLNLIFPSNAAKINAAIRDDLIRRTSFFLAVLLLLTAAADVRAQATGELTLVKPIERELKGGEVHKYDLALSADQFVYLVADQRGIDVVLTLTGPDAKPLVQVDSPNGTKGPEPIWYVTKAGGNYHVEVRSLEVDAKPGRYEIRLAELRLGTADDAFFAEAKRLKAEGDGLMAGDTDEAASKAFEKYDLAAKEYRQITDVPRKAAAIRELGGYGSNRKLEVSVAYYQEAQGLYERAGLKEYSALALLDVGSDFDDLQRYLDELDAYQKAFAIAAAIGDKPLQAKVLNQVGVAHARLGDFNQSLNYFNQALKLSENLPWTPETSVTMMGLGNVYGALGNGVRALEYEQNNIALLEQNGEKGGIPGQLLNIGNIYLGQGNCSQALVYFQKALTAFEAGRGLVGRSHALANMGEAFGCLGQYPEALDYIERSRLLKTKFLPKDPGTLSAAARVYRLQGNYQKAIADYQKSLDIYLEIHGLDFAAIATQAIAEIYYLQGNYAQSLEFADKAAAIDKQLNSPFGWASLNTSGYARHALGRTAEARKDLESAVAKIEGLRPQLLGGLNEPERYLETMAEPYRKLVDISVSENNVAAAFAYAERSKARSLLNILQTNKTQISKFMTPAERSRERSLRTEIASLNKQIFAGTVNARLADLDKQVQKKRLQFEDLQAVLYAKHPELRAQRGEMRPVGLEEAGALLPNTGSIFLEFVVADDKVFGLVIAASTSRQPSIKAFSAQVDEKDLASRVEKYRTKLANGDLDFQKDSHDLYDLLLKPAASQLAGKNNVIIVPDGPLWDLPFQALMDNKGRYLVEQAAVSYAPSLTALKEMSKRAKARTPDAGMELVAFGNPIVAKSTADRVKQVFMGEKLEPLPESERLVNQLGKMYGAGRSKVCVGDKASEETAKSESPKYRIVQFATHGILNNVSPMYSHLVLAQNEKNPNEDGLLEAWEMKDLDLKADMVVLSACDTARGRISNGEGVIGMTWAMFIAGTPTTVASQWKVESTSTTELMLEFHRQLLTGKVTKAEALRRAQLKLMKTPQFNHPSYWAGWVLVGDGS